MRRVCGPPAPARAAPALLACALLLLVAHAHGAKDTGICPSMDIRNSPEQIHRLKGCRVIEGQLSIVLMERATPKIYENMSFPDLREVTGFVLIYRTKGVRNLGDLFPNLTVVRGLQLFKDFAVVIFDNGNLESIGLRSLMAVQRGGVRIERNDRLCYVNTIDWSRINTDNAENIIRSNYDTRFCGLCPHAQGRIEDHRSLKSLQCPTDSSGRLLCWDENHCQKVCPIACESRGCLDNGTCCHASCLGGCTGLTAQDCHVCRSLSFGEEKRICIDSCPNGTYMLFRRCVTEQQCRSAPLPPQPSGTSEALYHRFAPRIRAYKIFNGTECLFMCPSGFTEVGNIHNATCEICDKDHQNCIRECNGGKIDSVAGAEQFSGCTHIEGKLEITMRAGGGATLSMLEKSLGEIREISGCLHVTRSYPLVSLMFLKSLKKITLKPIDDCPRGQALHILNNPNLELLWEWSSHGPLEITGGTIYIHLNPKLCYHQLYPLKEMTSNPRSNFTDIDVSAESNGNQASCLQDKLNLSVSQLRRTAVVLTWNTYCPDDMRKLLGYSLYYIPTEKNITLYEQRDACSDVWNAMDIPEDETRGNVTEKQESQGKNTIFKVCNNRQPAFQLLNQLLPYTRYAIYVKTYTTQQDKKGAQSPIIYFRTLPGRPSQVLGLSVDLLDPHSIYIRWSPPSMPNGTIETYQVEVQANDYNREQIMANRHSSQDYCTNPTALANLIATRVEEAYETEEEKTTGDVKNGTCACGEEAKPSSRFNVVAEEERMDSIHFENDLQNYVYRKSDKGKQKTTLSRAKRSVDKSLNKMLVKLTKNISPRPDLNYTNSTDEEGYVKSLYYKIPGDTETLTVTNLRHFTWYTVNVWACRTKDDNETKEAYEETWCSERRYYTFLTLELPNADTVSNLRSQMGSSNKTNEVKLAWDGPTNPNGFVVAYNVHYKAVDRADNPMGLCVNAADYERYHGITIPALGSGNYSIKVTPITVRGPGNVSSEIYVAIAASKEDAALDWVWGVVCGCLVMILILAGVIWYVKRGLLSPSEAHKLFASVNPEYVSTVYVPDEWEVPRGNIEYIRELGQGSFGMVYEGLGKGIVKGQPETRCAVKTVNEHATDRERIEFLNEASVMKAFDTFHVVRLMGVVSRGQPTLVVMELMELGDLKTYLRSHRPESENSLPKKESNGSPPTLQNILQMAIEIADGMAYLSAKKFVHRDLAARNCMVAGDLTVKVGDFGMTRDIYETDYYRKGTKGLLPVRWMSPESLKDGVFSSSSDAWSYGVVLWEMATLAMQPYQGLSNEQVVRYVVEGGVMERPEHCPDRLYELMRACWAHRPAARPPFLQLVANLAPNAAPYFRHRSFFHSPQGQEMYAIQRTAMEEEQEMPEVNVGAVATGSGSNLFGVSGRLASWVRELSSLRSRTSDDAAAEPLQPLQPAPALQPLKGPNGVLREIAPP